MLLIKINKIQHRLNKEVDKKGSFSTIVSWALVLIMGALFLIAIRIMIKKFA
jgi:hypothetical protein